MGRHAASGGDQPDRPSAPVAGGRRRTDHGAGLPADLPVDEVATGVVRPAGHDDSTTPGALRSRADRRRDALLADETDRRRPLTGRAGRPAVPAPPADPRPPARGRPAAGGATRAVPAAPADRPRTPADRPRTPADGATRQAPAPAPPAAAAAAPAPAAARPAPQPPAVPPTAVRLPAPPPSAPPAPQAPARVAGPVTTVAPFQAVPTPHAEPPAPSAAPLDPWDRPADRTSGRGRAADARPAAPLTEAIPDRGVSRERAPATEAIPDRGVSRGRAPATEAIPEREVVRGRAAAPPTEAIPDRTPARDRAAEPTGPATGPGTGATGVVGNRAAMRAERQAREAERHAMEVERRKAARRAGVSRAALRAADEQGAPPRRGRVGVLLLAAVVVALVVLGVYSYTAPEAQEAGSTSAPTTTAAPASVPPSTGVLPPLSVEPLPPVEEAPSTPVRVPVTVLNATTVNGLAADVAARLAAEGWTSAGVGSYEGGDIAATTVFFTEGDEEQRASAVQLMDTFPAVAVGPTPRFFEVPTGGDPGIVVVVAGEWPS